MADTEVMIKVMIKEGSIVIGRTLLPNILVNCSTYAFLLNFSFIKKRKHHS